MTDLSRSETRELAECEAVIQRGLATFIEVGSALLKIRDSRLYRASHGTFENYCQERWQMSRAYALRQIAAAEIAGNLSPIGDIPKSESVARPLAPLPPDQQRDAWKKATEEYGQPTAAQVKATVDEMFPRHEPSNGQGKLFEEETPEPPEPTCLPEEPWSDSENERRRIVESGGTVTANIKTDARLIAWAKSSGRYVRIDRTTAWGNPFLLDEDGDRDEICEAYRIYLQYKPSLQRRFEELRGKVLGCWCYPERCHGNVLIEQLDGVPQENGRVGCHR